MSCMFCLLILIKCYCYSCWRCVKRERNYTFGEWRRRRRQTGGTSGGQGRGRRVMHRIGKTGTLCLFVFYDDYLKTLWQLPLLFSICLAFVVCSLDEMLISDMLAWWNVDIWYAWYTELSWNDWYGCPVMSLALRAFGMLGFLGFDWILMLRIKFGIFENRLDFEGLQFLTWFHCYVWAVWWLDRFRFGNFKLEGLG